MSSQISNMPSQISNMPSQIFDMCPQISNMTFQLFYMPLKYLIYPSNILYAPQILDMLPQISNMPSQISNMPSQIFDMCPQIQQEACSPGGSGKQQLTVIALHKKRGEESLNRWTASTWTNQKCDAWSQGVWNTIRFLMNLWCSRSRHTKSVLMSFCITQAKRR